MSNRESAACERAVAAVLAGMPTPQSSDVFSVSLSTISRALRRRGIAPLTPRPADPAAPVIWVPRGTPAASLARVQVLAARLGATVRLGTRVRLVGLPDAQVAWLDGAMLENIHV